MRKLNYILAASLFLLSLANFPAFSQYTISGNAGVDSATLRYINVNPRTATADASGNYSFIVPSGFTGTVTPFKRDHIFSPLSITYTNVLADQTNQDYTATDSITSPIVWNGPRTVVFTKANSADWTLPSNQDQIMSDVWITRGNTQGIFNIAQESAYQNGVSPKGTEWAAGLISNYNTLTYTTGLTIPGGSLVGQNLVMHLVNDDIYVDVKFLSFTGSSGVGGFSYERSEGIMPVSVESEAQHSLPKVFKLEQNYPNPFNPMTTIEFILSRDSKVLLKVYNILGCEIATLLDKEMKAGVLHQVQFDASNLSSGIYFYRLQTEGKSFVRKLMLVK
jgi:hypothetical protein